MLAESTSLSHYFISRAMVEKGNRGKFLEWDDTKTKIEKHEANALAEKAESADGVKFSFGVIHVFSHGAPTCGLHLDSQSSDQMFR